LVITKTRLPLTTVKMMITLISLFALSRSR